METPTSASQPASVGGSVMQSDPAVALRLLGIGVQGGTAARQPPAPADKERRSSLEGQPDLNPDTVAAPDAQTELHKDCPEDDDLWGSYYEEAEAARGPDGNPGEQQQSSGDGEDRASAHAADRQEPAKKRAGRPKGSKNKKKKVNEEEEEEGGEASADPKKQEKVLWTDVETKFLIDFTTQEAIKKRFANTKEKNDNIWSDITDAVNAQFADRLTKSRQQVKDKYNNLVRAGRKHRLWLCRNDGTNGGSGNGRYVVERSPPPWYDELLNAGALEGPLGKEINVLHNNASTGDIAASISAALNLGVTDDITIDLVEETGGTEKADSREPFGGGSGKQTQGSESGRTGPGRPSNQARLLSEIKSQTVALTDGSKENTQLLSEAILQAGENQIQLARETLRIQKKEGKRNRMAFMAGFQMMAKALNPSVDTAFPIAIESDSDSE